MTQTASSRRALMLALALDSLGEPPVAWHPVVWMGSYLAWTRKQWQAKTPGGQLVQGGVGWGVGAAMTTGAGLLAARLPWPLQGVLLGALMSRRALFEAVAEVGAALEGDDLPEARRLLAWHLVSRSTNDLSAAEVAAAAIESLAENLSDSVLAPLLAFRLGGLPLAACYRLSNTADAMWGYRTPDFEYFGKVAARADDLLNLAPARLTALCVVAASLLAGLAGTDVDARSAWNIWRSDARLTSSPNAGHPMSAFAGALGLRLEKRGQTLSNSPVSDAYVLNAAGREAQAHDIGRALTLARWTLALAVPLLLSIKNLPLPGRTTRA
jgi:adenosylcobinamide-phosphate synthase